MGPFKNRGSGPAVVRKRVRGRMRKMLVCWCKTMIASLQRGCRGCRLQKMVCESSREDGSGYGFGSGVQCFLWERADLSR